MVGANIPDAVREFVKTNFRSVSTLEVFLLMIEDHESVWTPLQVSQILRSNETYAEDQLWQLVRSGLARSTPTGFQSACSEKADLCTQLKETFATKRSSIITFIYSRPNEPIKDLADAFVFNKKKE